MKVRDLMSRHVEACRPDTGLGEAAMIMWRSDCGVVPVEDPATRKVCGVITDRDICMALATTGRRPDERRVDEVMSRQPVTVRAGDEVREALAAMRSSSVRRLPVVDADGMMVGMLSLNDLILAADGPHARARAAVPEDEVMATLKAICRHRESKTDAPAGEIAQVF